MNSTCQWSAAIPKPFKPPVFLYFLVFLDFCASLWIPQATYQWSVAIWKPFKASFSASFNHKMSGCTITCREVGCSCGNFCFVNKNAVFQPSQINLDIAGWIYKICTGPVLLMSDCLRFDLNTDSDTKKLYQKCFWILLDIFLCLLRGGRVDYLSGKSALGPQRLSTIWSWDWFWYTANKTALHWRLMLGCFYWRALHFIWLSLSPTNASSPFCFGTHFLFNLCVVSLKILESTHRDSHGGPLEQFCSDNDPELGPNHHHRPKCLKLFKSMRAQLCDKARVRTSEGLKQMIPINLNDYEDYDDNCNDDDKDEGEKGWIGFYSSFGAILKNIIFTNIIIVAIIIIIVVIIIIKV